MELNNNTKAFTFLFLITKFILQETILCCVGGGGGRSETGQGRWFLGQLRDTTIIEKHQYYLYIQNRNNMSYLFISYFICLVVILVQRFTILVHLGKDPCRLHFCYCYYLLETRFLVAISPLAKKIGVLTVDYV